MNNGKTILLCNDELHVVRAIEHRFRPAGFTLVVVSDTNQARIALTEHRPDVVISDIRLGDGDCLHFVAELRQSESLREIPVLLLTDKGFELDLNDVCGRLGVLSIIPKPFSPKELLSTVRDILHENKPPAPQAFLRTNHQLT